jgi:hypothetical protein
MKGLSRNAIQYIFYHLTNHCIIGDHLNSLIVYGDEYIEASKVYSKKIIFLSSHKEIQDFCFIECLDRRIPVIFPVTDSEKSFIIDQNQNLVFQHDFLKSAFYILSGYQETLGMETDPMGRFKYENSLQKQLGFTTIPIVNYYFEVIILGLEQFCSLHSIPFKRKRMFDNFGFFLSHDVDRVSFYHPREVAFKVKQFIGLAPLYYTKSTTLKLFFKGVYHLLNPFKKQDPWWNFDYLINLEKQLNIRSTFYFLEKEHRNLDSRYRFNTPKIKRLISKLNDEGFEVGLHGTIRSATSIESLKNQFNSMSLNTNIYPVGIRQHFLKLQYPTTLKTQNEVGLKYDTTLAFAEHEGFRNGYCYPFKPYDFEADRMLDIWELPLMLMEVSVLGYKKEPYQAIEPASMYLISEVQKFGGFFSLLWHNCRLDEYLYPGITFFYENLLKTIVDQKPEVMRGVDIYKQIDNFDHNIII